MKNVLVTVFCILLILNMVVSITRISLRLKIINKKNEIIKVVSELNKLQEEQIQYLENEFRCDKKELKNDE